MNTDSVATSSSNLAMAQAEVREIYFAGSVGQAYTGVLWLVSAGLWTFVSQSAAIVVTLAGGFLIYPVTTVVCRILGSPGAIPSTNPLRQVGVAIPIVGPLMIPLVGAAALYDIRWFFPAFMIAIGAHYLPFAFLYGMREFWYIGGSMWAGGLVVGIWFPNLAVAGAWGTGLLLVLFSIWAALEFRSSRRVHG